MAIILGTMASPTNAMAATAPSVSIHGFTNHAYVSSSTLKVKVPHSSKQVVHLWLNGKYKSGNGSYKLKLRNGKNTISAQVLNKHNRLKSRVEHKYITLDTSTPKVSVSGLVNHSTVKTAAQKVTVHSSHAQAVHLWLNGKRKSGNKGTYSLELASGKNTITAQAVNNHDKKTATVRYYVTYTPAPKAKTSPVPPKISYLVYDFYGAKKGSYSTLSAAEKAVKSYPRGSVKNVSGKVVYTQTGYAAYQDPAHLIGVYSSYTTAVNKAKSAGYVVNASNIVDKQPSDYYYLSGGKWVSSEYGVQGSQTPPASKTESGIRYLPTTVNPGSSPYDTKYYPLEKGTSGNSTYIGKSSDSFIWENTYRTANLTLPSGQPASGSNIDNYIEQTHRSSSLYGLGYAYMDAEKFGSNAVYLFSHSVLESGWGNSSIAQSKNNLFGYGAYDSSPGNDAGAFPSDDYAIHFQSWFVRDSYLTKGASHNTSSGATLDGMSKAGYATDANWSAAVAGLVNNYANEDGYSAGTVPITPITDIHGPNGNGEPVYLADDFRAKVPAFPGNLNYAPNTTSDYVKTLQDALNASGCGPIAVDGQFGPATLTAVNKYQKKAVLPESKTVTRALWDKLFPSIQGLTSVSEVYMSYTNNLAIAQVLTNTDKRVFEPFIHFTNVYRVEPAGGAEGPQARIEVYSSDSSKSAPLKDKYGQVYLHAGDYVSNDNGGMADARGMVRVSFTQWRNGSPVAFPGYVPASALQMIKDAAGKYTLPTYNGLDPAHE